MSGTFEDAAREWAIVYAWSAAIAEDRLRQLAKDAKTMSRDELRERYAITPASPLHHPDDSPAG